MKLASNISKSIGKASSRNAARKVNKMVTFKLFFGKIKG